MTRAEMAAIINRSFGCYKAADISQYKDVSKSKWYYKDVALAVQMGTYNGRMFFFNGTRRAHHAAGSNDRCGESVGTGL